MLTQEQLDSEKRKAFRKRKYDHVPDLIGPDGQRWKWVNSRSYWAAVSFAKPEPPMFRNSHTMCLNRNKRRKSFGYSDTYSMRERGWPT